MEKHVWAGNDSASKLDGTSRTVLSYRDLVENDGGKRVFVIAHTTIMGYV